jgi:DMSO reductase family type II enzyme chaperone
MTSLSSTETAAAAMRRAAAYTLLAHLFAYPDDEGVESIRVAALEAKEAAASIAILRLASVAEEPRREAMEPAYVRLNTFSTSPDAPMFETAYFGSDAQQQTQRMADIAGFYRAFGVESVSGVLRPDDLPVELEFMAYLCRKEAYAAEHMGAPRVGQARRAQRMFLQEHLGRWAPVLGQKLASSEDAGPFYRLCGETLAGWVQRECHECGAAPEPVSGQVSKDWQQPVSHGPEFAGEPSFVPLEELAVG